MFEQNMDEYLDEEVVDVKGAFNRICKSWDEQVVIASTRNIYGLTLSRAPPYLLHKQMLRPNSWLLKIRLLSKGMSSHCLQTCYYFLSRSYRRRSVLLVGLSSRAARLLFKGSQCSIHSVGSAAIRLLRLEMISNTPEIWLLC